MVKGDVGHKEGKQLVARERKRVTRVGHDGFAIYGSRMEEHGYVGLIPSISNLRIPFIRGGEDTAVS